MHKTLFIIQGLDKGGLELYLLRFIKYSRTFLLSEVLCKGTSTHWVLEDDFRSNDCTVTNFNMGHFSLRSWFRFYQYLRKNKYQTVCDFTGDFAGIPILLAYLAGVPTRITLYRESRPQFKNSLLRSIYAAFVRRFVRNFSSSILSNSKEALNYFYKDHVPKNSKVIYNGLNKREMSLIPSESRLKLGLPANKIIVGHVGRFTPAKNHQLIFDLAVEMENDYPDVIFAFCGKGVAEALNNNNIKPENILCLGICNNIWEFLYSIDIFIFPSLNEGQPNALIEAMLANKPFIASDISTIRESVPEFYQSELITEESVDLYKQGIIKLIEDRQNTVFSEISDWANIQFRESNRLQEFLDEILS